MKKVIYINNDTIHILNGKFTKKGQLKVAYEKTIPLLEGTVLNGVIVNREEVLNQLKINKNKLKNATLVLNSSNMILKKMSLPRLSKKETLEVVKKEFALLQKDEAFVYDFTTTREGRKQMVIACGVPKLFVESYIELFEEVGIKLKAIDSVLNGVIAYVEHQDVFKDKNFVFNIIEKNTMLSLLFEKNHYMFSNKNRLTKQPNTQENITEIFSILSSINQFHKSQKSEHSLQTSYYIGLDQEALTNLNRFTKVIDQGISAELAPVRIKDSAEHFFMTLALDKVGQSIDLYKAVKVSGKVYLRDCKWLGKALNTVLLILVITSIYNEITHTNEALQNEITQVQQQLIDPVNTEALNEVFELREKTIRLDTAYSQIEEALNIINQYKIIDGDKIKIIYETTQEGTKINHITYTYETKSIEINGLAKGPNETQQFITRLKATGLFESVDYSGYSIKGEQNYSFVVRAVLKGGEANETDS